jgi:hypothetical protein
VTAVTQTTNIVVSCTLNSVVKRISITINPVSEYISASVYGELIVGQTLSNVTVTITGVNTTAAQLDNLVGPGVTIPGLTFTKAGAATTTQVVYNINGIPADIYSGTLTFTNASANLSCSCPLIITPSTASVPFEFISQFFTYNVPGTQITGFASSGDYNLLKLLTQSGYTSIELGSATVKTIGASAFTGCASFSTTSCLKRIGLRQITSIGQNAFSGCQGIASFDFGNSTVSITGGAFSNCRNAFFYGTPKITFATPQSNSAFGGCENLTKTFVKPVSGISGIRSVTDCKYVANTVDGIDIGGA